jgi:hypothetical protein
MKVALIKMQSGEDVIAELVNNDERDVVIINNPIVMVPQGNGQVGFAPWSPFLDDSVKELRIRRSYTVYISEPKAEVVKNYTEIFSPIITPGNAGKIIT